MQFSRYIAKRIFSALNACIHKLWNILFHNVPARDQKNLVLKAQCKHSDCLFHQSSENWIPSILWSLVKPVFLFSNSGSHLLSHIVSNAVPSAAWVLTIVFGMGTGVTPKRIATRNVTSSFDRICNLSSFLRTLLIYLKSAPLLFDRFKPSHASFLFRTIIQTSLMMFVSWTSRAQSLMTKQ